MRGDFDARRQCDVIATARTLINIMCETSRLSPHPTPFLPSTQTSARIASIVVRVLTCTDSLQCCECWCWPWFGRGCVRGGNVAVR